MTGKAAAKKDSLLHLVDTDGSGTIDAHEFAVLYDAIKRDLEEDLEKQAALEKEASSASRKFKMLLLFVAVLVSFLAASVAANFAVLFTFVDSAITTATTSSGLLAAKGSDSIIKTAIATQDVPIMAAPALDIDTLSEVKSLKVVYRSVVGERVEAQLTVVGVRKHNSTFVEFVTSVGGETVEALNGVASLVRYPTSSNRLTTPIKHAICSANATCSAFRTSGIDAAAALNLARAELEKSGFRHAARRLAGSVDPSDCHTGWWTWSACGIFGGLLCPMGSVLNAVSYYYSGYSWFATRHVVFFLHGWTANAAHMWTMYCTFGVLWCPVLEMDQFRHLVFVFPTSFINGYLPDTTIDGVTIDGGWGLAWNNPLDNSLTFEQGADALAMLMCGNANAFELEWCWGYGWLSLFGVDSSSEVMMIGFSNGGGMATYGNFAYGKTITKSVAIDYHAHADYSVWMPAVWAVTQAAGLNLKLYEACESFFFSTDGILSTGMTFGSAGQTFYSASTSIQMYGGFGYGYLPYKEFSFAAYDGRKFTWAVHGYDPSDTCNMNTMCVGCSGSMVHLAVPYFVGIIGDILDWVDGPSAPSSPSGGSSSSKPSPAPPPFPPASTWFLGIKPLKPVQGYGTSKFDPRITASSAKDSGLWASTASGVFKGSYQQFVMYEEMCPPEYERRSRQLRGVPAKGEIIDYRFETQQKAVESEMVELKAMAAMDDFSMTQAEFEKELYYMGLTGTKASKELTYSSIYDFEYKRAKEAGFFEMQEGVEMSKYRVKSAEDVLFKAELLMQQAMEAEMKGNQEAAESLRYQADMALLGPPSAPTPPRPKMTRISTASGIQVNRLCTSIRGCAGEAETCDGKLGVYNKYKEGANVGDLSTGKSLHAVLAAQLGAKGPFELFDTDTWNKGLKFSDDNCKGKPKDSMYTFGCVSTDDYDTQVEYMKEGTGNGDEISFKAAVHNVKKAVELSGKPLAALACFSQTTTACRLLQPAAAAEDAFRACFSSGADGAVAERVPMGSLVAGDVVLADEAAVTRVVVNQHAGVKAAAPMLTLHFEGGSLSLTADHVLLLDGVPSAARLANVGSVLSSGRKVSAVTHGSQSVINPITVAGTILAAGPSGEPVVAATANEWLADVLLSAYPKYTLSFNLAAVFPASVQAFYNSALEPLFSLAVPPLQQVKAAAPPAAVAAGVAVGDVLLAAGLLAFAVGKLALVAVAAVAASRFGRKA